MDIIMFFIGVLVNLMGFVWSGGCWVYFSGEDFQWDGDKWVLRYREFCFGEGLQKKNCFKIMYGDFFYIMKDVVFGQFEKELFGLENEQYLISYIRVGKNY